MPPVGPTSPSTASPSAPSERANHLSPVHIHTRWNLFLTMSAAYALHSGCATRHRACSRDLRAPTHTHAPHSQISPSAARGPGAHGSAATHFLASSVSSATSSAYCSALSGASSLGRPPRACLAKDHTCRREGRARQIQDSRPPRCWTASAAEGRPKRRAHLRLERQRRGGLCQLPRQG